jgi:hypothetical protein
MNLKSMLFAAPLTVAALCGQAHATAFAAVNYAFWQVDPDGTLPDGVAVSCISSSDDGLGGCMSSASLSVMLPGSQSLDLIGSLRLTNTTGADISDFMVFNTAYSAFNPGGPEIGASVDNPATQFASFFSMVSGPGVLDIHGCDTDGGDIGAVLRIGNACGVSSPDFSNDIAVVSGIAAGSFIDLDYEINIVVQAVSKDSVPEPFSLAIFGAGLLGAAAGRGRRSKGAARP